MRDGRVFQRVGLLCAVLAVLVRLSPYAYAQAVALYQGVIAGTASSQTGFLDLYSSGAAHRTRIQAADTPTAAVTWKMPAADLGAAGYLQSDGFGVLSVGAAPGAPFFDNVDLLKDEGDPTKRAQFQLSGITTGTVRTYTLPNVNSTLVALTSGPVFASNVMVASGFAFHVGTGPLGQLFGSTAQTPDAPTLLTSATSNSWILAESTDAGFDFSHPLQANPTMFFENAAQDQTQHQGVAFYGSQGRAVKALTETTATSVVRIPVAASAGVGGTITFTVFAADATDMQTLAGVLQYAAVNKAATETCATPTLAGTAINSVSAGTLSCTYACDTTPANAVDIQFNCTSSLTQTTLDLYWRLTALGASEPLPQ